MLRRFLQHPVVGGSAVLFAGAVVAGGLNYLFSVVVAREAWLGPVDYGTLAALTSVLYLVGLIGTTISTVTAKYAASFVAAGEQPAVGRLIQVVRNRIYRYGVPALILFAGGSKLIAQFFHIESPGPVLWLVPLILLTLLFHVVIGALQGVLKFTALALISVAGSALRLVLAVGAVLIGWRVSGVLAASVVAQGIVYSFAALPLRPFTGGSSHIRLPRGDILSYAGPVFIALVGITSFFSTDVILAKHFLSASAAGQYSGLSLLARMIYFASLPLTQVMFPVVSQRASQQRSTRGTVLLTLGALLALTGVVSALFFLWPTTVIGLTIGHTYLVDGHLLGLFALTVSFVSISSWLIHYLLVHHRTRAAWMLPVAAGLQFLLILRYHGTIRHIVLSSLGAASVLLGGLLLSALWWRWRGRETAQRN